nr:uncharacterized protein LOC125423671 isoform X2 [Ziziphus jujuba var. spinosa]
MVWLGLQNFFSHRNVNGVCARLHCSVNNGNGTDAYCYSDAKSYSTEHEGGIWYTGKKYLWSRSTAHIQRFYIAPALGRMSYLERKNFFLCWKFPVCLMLQFGRDRMSMQFQDALQHFLELCTWIYFGFLELCVCFAITVKNSGMVIKSNVTFW